MRRRIILLVLSVMLVLSGTVTASAQDYVNRRTGSISLSLVEPTENEPIGGVAFDLYHVATVLIGPNNEMNFAYTSDFRNCDISFTDGDLAAKLDAYLTEDIHAAARMVTNDEGKATSGELRLGMYLVKQVTTVDELGLCKPFVVTIPLLSGTELVYDVDAAPKTEIVWLTDISIIKKWNTDKTAKIPASVTVQLLRGDEVVETATLTKADEWKITYENMPVSDAYSIKEINIPKGYTATYSSKGYIFTVTNTASLAQTGQIVWPIPVLAAAGILFLMIGFLILRKPGKRDA